MNGEPWVPLVAESDVDARPRAASAGGVPLVVLRPEPLKPPVVFADRCPHRLVPLSAATVVDGGRLRCAYHGWEFDADGRCAALPSAGEGATPPARADLPPGPRTMVQDGMIFVHGQDLAALAADPKGLLSNAEPALRRAWHPVALSAEIDSGPVEARLLGRFWLVCRGADGTAVAEPAAHGVRERWGLVWLAPEEPLTDLFDDPDRADAEHIGAWLPPVRTTAPAGAVADNFLDVAHFPFVHAGTFGAAEERAVPPYEVTAEPDGCRSVQEQWFDNPQDPAVAAGLRPLRQRRRATYVYRAPFQLLLRLEELDAGAVKTILSFAQPESVTSTRIYTKLLLRGVGGEDRPGPAVLAREVAFEEAVLAEDLALQRQMRLAGLPLHPRDELHVRADLLGVTLRRTLAGFVSRASRASRATA